jgi:hypothetical protein
MAFEIVRIIQETGNSCELVRIPETDQENLLRLMRTLEIENTDWLVSLDGPSHEIRHRSKILVELMPEFGSKSIDTQLLGQTGVLRVFLTMETMKPANLDAAKIVQRFANFEELAGLFVGAID